MTNGWWFYGFVVSWPKISTEGSLGLFALTILLGNLTLPNWILSQELFFKRIRATWQWWKSFCCKIFENCTEILLLILAPHSIHSSPDISRPVLICESRAPQRWDFLPAFWDGKRAPLTQGPLTKMIPLDLAKAQAGFFWLEKSDLPFLVSLTFKTCSYKLLLCLCVRYEIIPTFCQLYI